MGAFAQSPDSEAQAVGSYLPVSGYILQAANAANSQDRLLDPIDRLPAPCSWAFLGTKNCPNGCNPLPDENCPALPPRNRRERRPRAVILPGTVLQASEGSIRLESGRPDHLGPLLGFV
jgi:hypothetical protein